MDFSEKDISTTVMSIVIVDDNVTNLVVLKHLAGGLSYQPACTFSKSEIARAYLSPNNAMLIVVDCNMPDLSGIDFTPIVRGFLHHRHTPIAMVTSHSEDKIRMKALQSGITDFLSKPVNPVEFRRHLRHLLELTAFEAELQ